MSFLTVFVTADQLETAVGNAGCGAVMAGQPPLALEPSDFAVVVVAVVVSHATRHRKLRNLCNPP